ncbi:MAG: hypothetical protein IT481_07840 [Gammaproteobacteria bacterium]|nr:hypothetical protein [Gammaproteobacteria bacterium]
MVLSIRNEQRQGRKPLDDAFPILRPRKALEQLPEHDARDDEIPQSKSVSDVRFTGFSSASRCIGKY